MDNFVSYLGNKISKLSVSMSGHSSADESHELISLNAFYQGYRRCRSDHEISVFVANHVKYLKWRLSDRDISDAEACDVLERCLICNALNQDVSFAGIQAIKLTSFNGVRSQVVGFAASQQLISPQSELSLLLLCPLQFQLVASNRQAPMQCMALDTAATLLSPDSLQNVESGLIGCLKNSNHLIRRKAVACFGKYLLTMPGIADRHLLKLRTALLDKDPGTMSASLQVYSNLPAHHIKEASNLLQPFLFILAQVTNGNLPSSFKRGGVCGPHVIVKLVGLLSKLDHSQGDAKQKIELAVLAVIDRYEAISTLPAIFVVSECLKVLPKLSVDGRHMARIAKYANSLMKSTVANYNSVGLQILTELSTYDKSLVAASQDLVISSLNSRDATVSGKAMTLIIQLTTPANIESVCELCTKMASSGQNTALLQKQTLDIITSCKLEELNIDWFVQKLLEILDLRPVTDEPSSSASKDSSTTVFNTLLKYLTATNASEQAATLRDKLKASLSANHSLRVISLLLWLQLSHREKLGKCGSEINKLISTTCSQSSTVSSSHDLVPFLTAIRSLLTNKLITFNDDEVKAVKELVSKCNAEIICSHYLEDIHNLVHGNTSFSTTNACDTSDEFWADVERFTRSEILSKRCRPSAALTVDSLSTVDSSASVTSSVSAPSQDGEVKLKAVKTVWTSKGRVKETYSKQDSTDEGACPDDSELAPVEFDIEEDLTTNQIASKIFSSV